MQAFATSKRKSQASKRCLLESRACWQSPRPRRSLMAWFGRLMSRRRRYNDLSVSIQEHIDEKVEELVEVGMPRTQAEQAARREFGNLALLEQRSREIWQWPL